MAPRNGNGSVHELSRIVGGLQEAVETLTRTWQTQDRAATEGRRELHQEVTQLRVAMGTLQEKVAPIVLLDQRLDKLEAARNQAIGAVWAARVAMAALGGAIGALLTKFGFK